jgi:hypothetical protein
LLKRINEKPLNIILIDNSASLNLDNRKQELNSYIKENLKYYFSDVCENKAFAFSSGIINEIKDSGIDSISYETINNYETNLSQTLNDIINRFPGRTISDINLISDGIINSGGSPTNSVKLLGSAFNYFLIGDTIQKKDLVLDNINFNKYAYIESSEPVKVLISSYSYNKPVNVNLFEENVLIDSKIINTSLSANKYAVDFNISSPVETTKRYKIEIEPQSDEITTFNNQEEFIVKFLSNKIKAMILSGGPGPDNAYLLQEIKKINNLEAKFYTQKSANEFYEGSPDNINDFQIFILAGFPTPATGTNTLMRIKEKLAKGDCSIFFIASRNTDYEKLSLIDEYLPFTAVRINIAEIRTSLSYVNALNDNLKNFKTLSSINSFTDIYKSTALIPIKPQAEAVLLFSNNREPALVTMNTPVNKSAAMLFYGFYKWRLNPNSVNSDEVLNSLITGCILSITDKEKRNKFFIETNKQFYSISENILFNASVNGFELKGNEKIRLRIFNDSFNNEFELEKGENLTYSGKVKLQYPGEYTYSAELVSDGNAVEKLTNKFVIGESRKEYKETRSDPEILNQIAALSGGKRLNGLKGTEILDFIENNSRNLSDKTEFSLKEYFNTNVYYLFLIIFLLSLEWLLRKRNNLP